MRRQAVVLAALTWSAAGGLLSCESDDSTPAVSGTDAASDGAVDGSVTEAGEPADSGATDSGVAVVDSAFEDRASIGDATFDAGVGQEAGSDAAVPTRMLLSFNGSSQSELVAFNLSSSQIDGHLLYPASFGTTSIGPKAPWLLEESSDVVARLDPTQPWKIASSWNVALHDMRDGGDSYADPDAVVVGAGTKAYVLRYTRNEIAIVDPSTIADGGAPTGTIDLSSQVQAGGDGIVEMSAGVYVPSKNLVYVVLGNINRSDVGCDGYCLLCANTQATVIAIDVTTDAIVDLNGASAPGMGLALSGYDPGLGQGAIAYDSQADRLLVLESGCNQVGDDGGVGPLVGREVEELSLFTGASRTLLDLTSSAYPQQLVYIDANRAIVQLDTAYAWDPTTPDLGPSIPNAPDTFAWDGVANLVGFTARYGTDGGLSGYDVVSVRMADGLVTKLGADPFSLTSGFPNGVELWPSP
jgi:hypothetical protein